MAMALVLAQFQLLVSESVTAAQGGPKVLDDDGVRCFGLPEHTSPSRS